VIHSATKYLAGHGDLLAGAILTSVKTKNKILPWLDHLGSALHAHGAWMLQRGLATFELRFQRHQASALWLAEMLQTMSGVGQVYYPGLKSHPQRELFQRQMTGGGGVVSFELDGDQECVQRFLCRLERIAIARSLGEPKTLVAHPWSMHYRALTDQEKIAAGISPSLIRLAVGLEDRHEILDDIQQALCR
jgi:cystathionine beta-lyase/cystathionine gamma-synthase